MPSQVTALAWRPQTFDDLVGQDVVSQTLKNAITSKRLHHAYLFSGLRGSGKTSSARIFSKALNCEQGPTPTPCLECTSCVEIRDGNSLDVVEIDAASNNSVDNIRELRELVRYNASRDRYKIYIIDEVHMLSTSAFNALLKTLEEPPPHVIFIMATTELHKIPATILSRTQQFDFRQIPLFKIEERLRDIAKSQEMDWEAEALALVAQAAGGSMRDALSIYDQVVAASGEKVTGLDVKSILGVVEDTNLIELLEGVVNQSPERIFSRINELVHYGHDLKQVYDTFTAFIRDSLVLKTVAHPSDLVMRTYGHGEAHDNLLKSLTDSDLVRILNVLVTDENLFRQASEPRYAFELVFLKLLEQRKLLPLQTLLTELKDLQVPGGGEKKKPLGTPKPKPAVEPSPGPERGPEPEIPSGPTAEVEEAADPQKPLPSDEDFFKYVKAKVRPSLAALVGNAFHYKLAGRTVTLFFDKGRANIIPMIRDPQHFKTLRECFDQFLHGVDDVQFSVSVDPEIQNQIKREEEALEIVKSNPRVKYVLNRFEGNHRSVPVTRTTQRRRVVIDIQSLMNPGEEFSAGSQGRLG